MYATPSWLGTVSSSVSAAAIAFTADDVDDVLRWAVEHVCALTGWPVGHVLLIDPDMNPRDFADQYLFKPLGITNVKWDD